MPMDNFSPVSRSVSRPVVVGFVLGALFALPAILAAIMSGGAGHGDYVAARALFPASMLLTLVEGRVGVLSMGIGLLQFPIYGGLLGWANVRRNFLPVLGVASVHLVAAMLCFSGAVPDFS